MEDHPSANSPSQFSLPPYPELIMAAIEDLNEPNGSNKTAISKHIEAAHPALPPSHPTLLSYHLNQMKQSGQLVMAKNNYMKPDPNAPPKRGRGRPPKRKEPAPPGQETAASSPRPRGRPPKLPRETSSDSPTPPTVKVPGGTGRPRGRPPKLPRDPSSDPESPPAVKASVGTGRPRGRPPKLPRTDSPPAQATGERRGRGRPPKVKPVVAPIGC